MVECQVCHAHIQRGWNPKHFASRVLKRHLQRQHLRDKAVSVTGGSFKSPAPCQQRDKEGENRGSPSGSTGTVYRCSSSQGRPQFQENRLGEGLRKHLPHWWDVSPCGLCCLGHPLYTGRMLHHLAPWYTTPSRRTLSQMVPSLPSVVVLVQAKLS